MAKTMKKSKLPKTDSIQKLAQFWDTHELTNFDSELEEVTEPVFSSGAIRVPLNPREAEVVKRREFRAVICRTTQRRTSSSCETPLARASADEKGVIFRQARRASAGDDESTRLLVEGHSPRQGDRQNLNAQNKIGGTSRTCRRILIRRYFTAPCCVWLQQIG